MLAPDFEIAKEEIEQIVQSGFIKEDLEKYKQDFDEAVATGGEDAVQYLAAKEGLQDKLRAVLSDEKAQEQSAYWAGMAIKDYQVVKDAGGYDGNFEDFANQYFALNRLQIENYAQMSEEEKDEIWNERLAETAVMSDEDRYREESGRGVLYSAAMYRSPLKDFEAFYDDVLSEKNKKPRFYTKTVNGVELDIPSNALHHDNNKHGLTKEEWVGILQAINDNRIDESRLGDYNRMNGIPVKMVVDVDGVKYGVTFEHMTNGRNLIQTAFEVTDKGWIKNKSSQTAASEPQPKSGRLGNSMPAIISYIEENVKGDNKLYSKALEISEDDLTKVKNSLKKPLSQEAISRSFAARNAGKGRGYMSGGESTNAAIARSEGLATAQEIAKAIKEELKVNVTAKDIINSQSPAETHHTGSHFKETDFYDVEEFDIDELNKELRHREWRQEQNKIRDEQLKSLGAYRLSNEELAKRAAQGTWEQVRSQFKSDRETRKYLEGITIQNELGVNSGKLYSETFGSYDPSTQMVRLMAGHNPSTLTHELSHHFFISHIRLMEEMGLNDRNRPVFDWLSKKGGHEINSVRDMRRADWENMTEAFIEYMNTNEAPNLVTKSLFQRAKEWLLDNYRIHRTDASPEIRDYFDGLIARDTAMPDVLRMLIKFNQYKYYIAGEDLFSPLPLTVD